MKTEQIRKRAASLFSNAIDQTIYRQGAMWRINSVWHRADEKPEDRRAVLATTDDGIPFIGGPDNSKWEEIARELGITAWHTWTTCCQTRSTRYSKRTRTY